MPFKSLKILSVSFHMMYIADMADKSTLNQYDSHSTDFISRYQTIKPGRMYELMAVFFKRGGTTLDIGCASGRDLAYMKGSGYEVEGLDAVASFVEHCQKNLTDIPIYYDALPELKTVDDERFDNVLLSAVLMHVPEKDIMTAAQNILRITKPGGRILISIRNFRESEVISEEGREKDGRLFTHIPADRLIHLFEELGSKTMFQEDQEEGRREDVIWHNFVFEKN